MQGLGTRLARLGGADPYVLARAKQIGNPGASKEQARFVSLGLVLLAASSLAALSMTFAMTDGLHVGQVGAVLLGLFWGTIILVVDRALILSLKPKGGRWLLFWMILPRIVMAALLGLVVSTPLVLQVFNDEIEQQMTVDNIKKAEAVSATLAGGDRQKKLDALKAEIAKYEGHLAGNVLVTSPDLIAAEKEYERAQADYEAKQAGAETAWAVWRCELDGELCAAGSGKTGNGPRAQALKREYDRKHADANAAWSLLQQKQTAQENARTSAREQNGTKVAETQTEANRVLPGLRMQRDELQVAIQGDLAISSRQSAADTGLLARLVALSHLGDENGWARIAHLVVAALLFMIELLPVAVKSLSIPGPPTVYDQIDDFDSEEILRAAGQHVIHQTDARRLEHVDKDLVQKILAGIGLALHGPPLVNYEGWINVAAGGGSGVTLSRAQRRLTLDALGAFEVTVTIAPDDRGEVSERLVVTGGRDAPEVEFTVEVNSDRAALRHPPVQLRVDAPDGAAEHTFAFHLTDAASGATPRMWIRVSQAHRTLQNIELSIEIALATENQ